MKKRVVLYDVDSRIPNLALMKLSRYYKGKGYRVVLSRRSRYRSADRYFASAVFNSAKSRKVVEALREIYGEDIAIGGTGVDLATGLDVSVDDQFPDYSLYHHDGYALGFLTRGCDKRCAFCVVPKKEGALQPDYASFDDFVPKGQGNVMLLDNSLLAAPNALELLEEMIRRGYRVNFSQTLDIQHLTDEVYEVLRRVKSVNSRFTRRMFYFSCNTAKQIEWFRRKSKLLKGFGRDQVTVVIMYGFNTRLSEDFEILRGMRALGVVPFVQEYQPIPGVPARIADDYFDMDLDEVAAFRFRTNGQNGEKFLRYVNRLYFERYGRYYLPLLEAVYRYNNKPRLQYYLDKPELLSTKMYKGFV